MSESSAPAATAGAFRLDVRLFGPFRTLTGVDSARVALPPGATVADLIAALRGREELAALPERPAVAVNREYAAPDRPLGPGDEVALIPPVAGG